MLKINAKEIVENPTHNKKPIKSIVLFIDLIFEYNKIIRSKFNKKSKDVIKSYTSNFWNIAKQIEEER